MQGEDMVAGISTREDLNVMKNNMAYAELLILHTELYMCLCVCNLFIQFHSQLFLFVFSSVIGSVLPTWLVLVVLV
jgi:hypothetical protein